MSLSLLPRESALCRLFGGRISVSVVARRRPFSVLRSLLGLMVFGLVSALGAHAQFGAVAVGSSSTQTITVTAQTADTVSTVSVVTAGAAGLDFTAASGGSCAGAGLASGGKCTQPVTFNPAYVGVRMGAVVLLDSGNNIIGTAFLNGTGTGGLGLLVPSAAQSAAIGGTTPLSQLPAAGTARTVAGDGKWQDSFIGDGGQATQAELFLPSAVAIDGLGNFYIADSNHERIRMVCAGTTATIAGTSCAAEGIISTVAGATGTQLRTPSGIALDGAGNLYIADTGNHVVRELNAATGAMTTMAGTGTSGYTGDGGPATSAELAAPFSVAVDGAGNLFIADNEDNVIRGVCAAPGALFGVSCSAAGDIVTVAGTGVAGALGDNGPASAAELNGPYSLALDPYGNLFIADTENDKVRAVCAAASGTLFGTTCSSVGMIFTVTGDGNGNFSGDGGPASSAEINSPSGLAFDPAGNLYLADTQNNRIRKINATTGIIITLAGNGGPQFGGDDGPALGASMHGPYGIAFYNAAPGGSTPLAQLGDLLISDFFNQRIRSIQSNLAIVTFQDAVRQGYTSPAPVEAYDPTLVTVENDGNAALDLTTLTAGANTEIGTQGISGLTLCADGNSLTMGTQCTVEPIFAPAGSPPLTQPSEQETGNIDVNNDVVPSTTAANSPLVITVDGTATLVNPTKVALTSTPNPSNFGQSVTFTATVSITSGSGTPTGTVDFFDGATKLDTTAVTISAGEASFSISTLTVGLHNITATYNGDSNDATSTSNTVQQTVDEQTATAIQSSANPSALGSSVTFTATVTIAGGGGVTLVGTVTFLDGGNPLGPAIVLGAGGTARFATSSLAEGPHSITAVYNGDLTDFLDGSTSAVLTQDVLAPSTVVLSPPVPNPSTYGTTVTLTATVSSSGTPAPTGSVNFLDDGNKIGSAPFTGNTGVATFTISTLAVGPHSLTATYAGDSNVGPGASNTQTLTVNPAATSTTVSATPSPGIAGKAITFSATVSALQGSGTITGSVSFTANGQPVCQGSVGSKGGASCTAALAPGTYSIVASYSGNTNDNSSTSTALSYKVIQATTQVVLTSSANPAQVLSAVVFKAVVSGNGGTPTGQVKFSVDGASVNSGSLDASGAASFSDSSLPVGSHQIVATYAGDTDDAGSSSSALTQVINPIPTVTDLGQSSTGGATPQAILVATTLAATGPTPTGTITFKSGGKVIGSAPLDPTGVATLTPDLAPGNYSIIASYGGDSIHSPSTSAAVSITGLPQGFSITVNPSSLSLATGQNGTVSVTITATSGFSDTIGMGCLTVPAAVNCHFSSNSVKIAGGQSQTIQLTIDTNAPLSGGSSASVDRGSRGGVSLADICLPAGLLFGFAFWRFRRRHLGFLLGALVLFLASAFAISGCGGSFSQVTAAPGTYTLQVGGVGDSSNIQHYQSVTLTVTQ